MSVNQNGPIQGDQNDYNKGGMVTLLLSMVASCAVMIYVAFFSGGIDLKEIKEQAPGATQQMAGAAEVKKIDVSGVTEPWLESPDMIEHGKQLYTTNCAMCHGATGEGNGPAGGGLNPKPRNLVEGNWTKGGNRIGLFKVLHDGIAGTSMQAYKHMPKNDRWALVHYVRSITKNKVDDNDTNLAAQAAKLD